MLERQRIHYLMAQLVFSANSSPSHMVSQLSMRVCVAVAKAAKSHVWVILTDPTIRQRAAHQKKKEETSQTVWAESAQLADTLRLAELKILLLL